MKHLIIWNFIIVLSIGKGVCQNPEEILKKHYRQYNQAFWDQIRTMNIKGIWFEGESPKKNVLEIQAKKPDKILIRGKVGEQFFKQGFDGVSTWEQSADYDDLSEDEKLMLRNFLDFGSPIPRNASLDFQGLTKENAIPVYWFREKGDQNTVDYYMDKEDLYVRKVNIYKIVDGETISISKTYDLFKNFSGLPMPTILFIRGNNFEREFVFDDLILGQGIPNANFVKPE